MSPSLILLMAGLVLGLVRLACAQTNGSASAGSDERGMGSVNSLPSSANLSSQGQESVSDSSSSSSYGSEGSTSREPGISADYSSSGSSGGRFGT